MSLIYFNGTVPQSPPRVPPVQPKTNRDHIFQIENRDHILIWVHHQATIVNTRTSTILARWLAHGWGELRRKSPPSRGGKVN